MKKIVIIGHGRSGTTLLNRILDAHPDIAMLDLEFNHFPFFYELKKYYPKKTRYKLITKDIINSPFISTKVKDIDAKDFKDFIDKILEHHAIKKEKNISGFKVANNIKGNVDLFKNLNLDKDYYYINIIRDPRDVFLSLREAGFARSDYYTGKSWKEGIKNTRKLRSLKNYYEIKYETLIQEPEKEIKKICKFLKVRYYDNMNNFYKKKETYAHKHHNNLKKPIMKDNFNKWQKKLSKKERKYIEIGTGNTLYELGYSDKKITRKICFITRLIKYSVDKIYKIIKFQQIWYTRCNKKYFLILKIKRRYLRWFQ